MTARPRRSPRLKTGPYTIYVARGHRRRRVLRAVLIGALAITAIVALGAGGAYLWLDSLVGVANRDPEVSAVRSVIDETPDASAVDAGLEKPDAQDILILGSDARAGQGETYGRSDTLIIVHIDPAEDYVGVLSLPRDLRVEVPGHGMQKINAAFAYGGPVLAIRTVQQVTRLDLDHYVNVDFEAFRSVTTALGGIYVDVDRRYYYAGDQYENIDIKAGYQRLAGEQALDYVRFRHDSNIDFGRIERQHRFAQSARDQIATWDTALKVPELVRLVAENVKTDIGTTQALKLALWGLKLDRARINQVNLVSRISEVGGGSYVVATDDAMREAVRALVTPPPRAAPDGVTSTDSTATTTGSGGGTVTTAPVAPDLTGITVNVFNGNGRPGEGAAAAAWLKSLGAVIGRVGDASRTDMQTSVVMFPPEREGAARVVGSAVGVDRVKADRPGGEVALVLGMDFVLPEEFRPRPTPDTIPDRTRWADISGKVSFVVRAPAVIPEGYTYRDYRLYTLETEKGAHPALKVYYKRGGEDQYLGLMQTTYLDAPVASPGTEHVRGPVTYTVVGSYGKIDRVWWRADGVLYWVSNTLFYYLDEEELLAFAESTIPMTR